MNVERNQKYVEQVKYGKPFTFLKISGCLEIHFSEAEGCTLAVF
jgi:hypothetical protein